MKCLGCGYTLLREQSNCPECGRPFDPDRPDSFDTGEPFNSRKKLRVERRYRRARYAGVVTILVLAFYVWQMRLPLAQWELGFLYFAGDALLLPLLATLVLIGCLVWLYALHRFLRKHQTQLAIFGEGYERRRRVVRRSMRWILVAALLAQLGAFQYAAIFLSKPWLRPHFESGLPRLTLESLLSEWANGGLFTIWEADRVRFDYRTDFDRGVELKCIAISLSDLDDYQGRRSTWMNAQLWSSDGESFYPSRRFTVAGRLENYWLQYPSMFGFGTNPLDEAAEQRRKRSPR